MCVPQNVARPTVARPTPTSGCRSSRPRNRWPRVCAATPTSAGRRGGAPRDRRTPDPSEAGAPPTGKTPRPPQDLVATRKGRQGDVVVIRNIAALNLLRPGLQQFRHRLVHAGVKDLPLEDVEDPAERGQHQDQPLIPADARIPAPGRGLLLFHRSPSWIIL